MIRKFLLVVVFVSLTQGQATAMIDLNKYSEKLQKPIAKVEDQIITEEDLQQKMAIMGMSGANLTRQEALDNLITQQAILKGNNDRSISQEAINYTIKKFATDNGISQPEFDNLLKKFNIKLQHLKQHIAAQLTINEMVMEKIKNISQSQRELYRKSRGLIEEINQTDKILSQPVIEYTFNKDSQVKVAEIIVKQGKNFQPIIEMLKQNELFSKIKETFPNEVELATPDGIIGWLNFSDMSDLYKEVIKNTRINDVGEPLVANNAFLFIKPCDMRNVTQSQKFLNQEYLNLSFNEKSDQIQNKSLVNLISANIVQQLKQQLYIEIF